FVRKIASSPVTAEVNIHSKVRQCNLLSFSCNVVNYPFFLTARKQSFLTVMRFAAINAVIGHWFGKLYI
ncbi:hypothetical protein X975_17194, partial [Stegodyphus mimosarum]